MKHRIIMFFNKKSKKEEMKCDNCKSEINEEFSYCPYCGTILFDINQRSKDLGMLGKTDALNDPVFRQKIAESNLTITDKMIGAIFNSLMKNLDQQMNEANKGTQRPGNIKIKIGIANPNQMQKPVQKKSTKHNFSPNSMSKEQLEKISKLPRTNAKTNMKRLGDKIIYDLHTPGIESIKDIFVSKLESGYEIKALAKNKVYVNSLPVNLPINSFTLTNEKLSIEFSNQISDEVE